MSEGEKEYNRTELAEDRTIMAVERTFAGWMRTSFAAIGIGLAFKALFGELDPPWLARVIATIFILLAAFLAITAERRACRAVTRMKTHSVDSPDAPHLRYVAWAVAAGSVVLAIAIWLMNGTEVPIPGMG
ncbi:YidH family protein [Croceicoccus naphthovorans]|uniref:Uncharacterized protein n=1 Tax=Croceicoccus naphthovorans TaxID=1348774 RepID=A0A0G3XEF4_9SPHN|nr:DUF202 domain-containing protein [Croceicoccus naphthovorans]AKM08999.1 hypothetical protein AB433_01860 [Croceicoccus naphthovorans]MBB3989187.1 putative membrane protein [Croceicoccus naphthovorans]